MGIKLIMENWRSFQEGEQAYEKYLDMTQDEKERDAVNRDGQPQKKSKKKKKKRKKKDQKKGMP